VEFFSEEVAKFIVRNITKIGLEKTNPLKG
jgi:hypothetical protein